MKIWLIWEEYCGEENLIGIVKTREKIDEVIKRYFERYKSEVGNIWWEEREVEE